MFRRSLITAVTVVAALTFTASAAVAATDHQPPRPQAGYYLSLGDSLSQGVQPTATGESLPTDQGFTDQLYAMLRPAVPGLRLQKLGCPGETTGTMINGGICGYNGGNLVSYTDKAGSQLAAALAFIHQHPVRLITIVIGANNILPCLTAGAFSAVAACVEQQLPIVATQLTSIVGQLRAADPRAMIVGMTYYDVSLADWLTGSAGQAFATESLTVASAFRQLLMAVYQGGGARVADVYSSFRTPDTTGQLTLPSVGTVPEDVGLLCSWTWMCTPPPQGPNVHANIVGYHVIARTFLAAILRSPFQRGGHL
jgi:lysophospholipase L1-like esterase